MSGGRSCKCSERDEPLTAAAGANRPARLWRVIQRRCNHSAFNGYHHTSSDYSSISCLRCGSHWRTKSGYVADLLDLADDERNISPGFERYREAMERLGRTAVS